MRRERRTRAPVTSEQRLPTPTNTLTSASTHSNVNSTQEPSAPMYSELADSSSRTCGVTTSSAVNQALSLGSAVGRFAELYGLGSDMEPILMVGKFRFLRGLQTF